MPVSARGARPSEIFAVWSLGASTVYFTPTTASESIGSSVPHSTANAMTMNTKLLNRKLASRLTIDLSRASAVSNGSRLAYSAKLATPETIRNARKKYPTLDWVNECTLEITPQRVMNVPKIYNSPQPMIKAKFHFFNIPRFSWIITEWRNAVIVSHGRSDAFSTGSHAQYPPHPSST